MDDFGAAVIHDIKNQLAELALRLERRGDSLRETGIALDAARRLTALLIAYRYDAGALAVHVDAASPAELLHELADEYRVFFPELRIIEQLDDAPAFWFYDEALVRIALANAVHNACRHARQQVLLSADTEDGRMRLRVQDDGPGYAAGLLESGPHMAPASRQGTGIGLYLASRIAGLHQARGRDGEVRLANGGGASFSLILP